MAIVRASILMNLADPVADGANLDMDAELDIGDDTIAVHAHLFVDISDWATGPPNGHVRMRMYPRHSSGGNDFDGAPMEWIWPVTMDLSYRFCVPIVSLPRYSMFNFLNDSGMDMGGNGLTSWIEFLAVT